jgi:hypothetical protein
VSTRADASAQKTILFTLTSARSGTLYLRELFRHNVCACISRHEPFFDWGNPTLFGRVIFDVHAGRRDKIRKLLAKKRAYVERLNGSVYLESSHAFLKSAYVAAMEYFPEMRLIHLIRDPMRVAKSEEWRIGWRQRLHAPLHFYLGEDGKRHFAWGLTGNEQIFQSLGEMPLSLFQWCLVQWIEIENRAMRFLRENELWERCFTLHCPRDLNDRDKLKEMFDFFGLETLDSKVRLGGRRNKSLGTTTAVSGKDEAECTAVLNRLPACYLEIFEREPYAGELWSERLKPVSVPATNAGAQPLTFQIVRVGQE